MAKITTIIDIGSNSMRMVVYKKTSRFAYYLLNETKSKVKISENSYLNNSYLQPEPLNRAFETLKSFLAIAKKFKSRKILCVATSALRDAPNKNQFINKVKKELKLNIKVIDGKKEAFFGAVATINLLHLNSFITIDIGGGSTELAIIKDKKIIYSFSLNIGTVRIKELFIDKGDFIGAKEYILKNLNGIKKYFDLDNIVVLGGTARALSKAIMKKNNYKLSFLHGFEYEFEKEKDFFEQIINSKTTKELKKLYIQKDRFDTIISGTFIFKTILEELDIKKVTTSEVGIREGVYLADLLRNSNYLFPANFNVSVRGLLDKFVENDKFSKYLGNNAKKIFQVLSPLHQIDKSYQKYLVIASKLSQIGAILDYYKKNELSSEFILNGLKYGFSHSERVLIASIIKYSKNFPKKNNIKLKSFLPKTETLKWLCFMYRLNEILFIQDYLKFEFELKENNLIIKSNKESYIISKELNNIEFNDIKIYFLKK